MNRLPFTERNTKWRGVLDLATGQYPDFLFGGELNENELPVFHFHDIRAADLEPLLVRLKENGYQTVTTEAVSAFVNRGIRPAPKSVVLCFDDAWASLWTVVFPLLKKYGMQAVAFVIAGRVENATAVREAGETDQSLTGESVSPLATWPELKAMHEGGAVDIQAHTWSHAKVFAHTQCTGFVTPDYNTTLLSRPLLKEAGPLRFVESTDLGCPLYPVRSSMSDVLRYIPDEEDIDSCIDWVRERGGEAFFQTPNWEKHLQILAEQRIHGRFETFEEQYQRVMREMVRSREVIKNHIGHEVRCLCFPWAVAGNLAESLLVETGYEIAFADQLWGRRIVRRFGNPFRLMRLKHPFIRCLPGRERVSFFAAQRNIGYPRA